MREYRITNKNIMYLFKEVIMYAIILVLWLGFLYYYIEFDINLFVYLSLITLVVYLVMMLLPVVYLYENYDKYNNQSFTLRLEERRIVYDGKPILLSEIKKVRIIATYQYFNGRSGGVTSLPYNPYFYYIEIITEEKKYILTSLLGFSLGDDIKEMYPSLVYEEIRAFPRILG